MSTEKAADVLRLDENVLGQIGNVREDRADLTAKCAAHILGSMIQVSGMRLPHLVQDVAGTDDVTSTVMAGEMVKGAVELADYIVTRAREVVEAEEAAEKADKDPDDTRGLV